MPAKKNIKSIVKNFFAKNNLNITNSTIAVCVSGGADSIALAHILCELKDKLNFNLYIIHINHKTRKKESDDDAKFVRAFADSHKINFIEREVIWNETEKSNNFSEEILREKRYELIFEETKKIGAKFIALAHNKNDVAENFLIRLIRSSGSTGLSGLREISVSEDHQIIRPFLNISRSEIIKYLSENNIAWREDSSNQNKKYLRNKVRHELIPLLEKEFNPSITEALSTTHDLLSEEDTFLHALANKEYQLYKNKYFKNNAPKYLDNNFLNNLSLPVMRRVLRIWIMELSKEFYPPSFLKIKQIVDLLNDKRTGKTIEINDDLSLYTDYDRLIVSSAIDNQHADYVLFKEKNLTPIELDINKKSQLIGGVEFKIKIIKAKNITEDILKNKDNRKIYLDADKVSSPLFIRSKKDGDRLAAKKIKEIFIDEKVPKYIRDYMPILENNSGVLWIVGFRKGASAKVDTNAKTVIEISV